jgi:MFS family permease
VKAVPPWFRVALAMFGVGWGANQFSSLLLVYRDHDGLPATVVTLLFGAYAIGLVPALLVAAAFSDRWGRRRVMRPVVVLAALASVVLLLAGGHVWALTTGRLLAGVASGAAFGPGTAWVKELSTDAGQGAGARRAAVALSAGFGGGPLVAGALAQWVPLPTVVPYLAHVALMAVIVPLVWQVRETVPAVVPGDRRTDVRRALRHRDFRFRVAPTAPIVFGAATASFAVLPGLVRLHGLGPVVGGAVAGLTLGTGVVVQPIARLLDRKRPGWTYTVGMALAVAGFLLAATTALTTTPLLLVPSAVVLGGCYGMLLVAGLNTVEELAAPDDLASVTAVFYCLTYVGFATPYVVTATEATVPTTILFVLAALAAVVILAIARLVGGSRGRAEALQR